MAISKGKMANRRSVHLGWPSSCSKRDHGGVHVVKVALTIWEGRISPVFDVSREAVILTIENGVVTTRCHENISTPTTALKPDRLARLGVKTLICGAISESLHRELTARGVNVLGFVAGEIDEVVATFLAHALPSAALCMPGCCAKRKRPRSRRGGRLGGGTGRQRRQ